jgi:hypothetical protein
MSPFKHPPFQLKPDYYFKIMSVSVRSHEENLCDHCDNWCGIMRNNHIDEDICCRCYSFGYSLETVFWCRPCKHTQSAPFAHEE